MAIICTIVWFICGIAGIHLVSELHEVDSEVTYNRNSVWMALMGPGTLLAAILVSIIVALTKEKTR